MIFSADDDNGDHDENAEKKDVISGVLKLESKEAWSVNYATVAQRMKNLFLSINRTH